MESLVAVLTGQPLTPKTGCGFWSVGMNFEAFFKGELDSLHQEGRYRVFADLERHRGSFPRATRHTPEGKRDVTVWCSNDYLGMGQHPAVIAAMHEAIDHCARVLAAPEYFWTTHYHVLLEQELADLHARKQHLSFTSGYVSNWATLGTLGAKIPGLIVFFRCAKPRFDDRRHSLRQVRTRHLEA